MFIFYSYWICHIRHVHIRQLYLLQLIIFVHICLVHCSDRKRSNLIVLVAHTDDPTGNIMNLCLFNYLLILLFQKQFSFLLIQEHHGGEQPVAAQWLRQWTRWWLGFIFLQSSVLVVGGNRNEHLAKKVPVYRWAHGSCHDEPFRAYQV